jgi:pyruvate dehydrogenase E2 component (dihydrolipoamide acetyltransferase)
VMMACAKSLRKHPQVNSSWEGDNIRQWGGVHVAMAVALPTGLITPVIRNTDGLGILQIAQMSRALATRAKGGELKPEDYTGGTFTVSNLGMFGIEEFTAIINPPQAAILAVGTTIQTPWVQKDQVVVQPRMKMTMSCDHRVVDGALGAQFLQTLVTCLEDPMMMLA